VKLTVIHGEDGELPHFLGHRHHNDGDGTSGSSHGTASPSPDSLREPADLTDIDHQLDTQVLPAPALAAADTETNDKHVDVIVMPQDLVAATGMYTISCVFLMNC